MIGYQLNNLSTALDFGAEWFFNSKHLKTLITNIQTRCAAAGDTFEFLGLYEGLFILHGTVSLEVVTKV